MEPNKPNNVPDNSKNGERSIVAGTISTQCPYNWELPVMDTSLTQFRNQAINLSNKILRDSIAYVDVRLNLQTASRMRALYENNRPAPAWLTEPFAQEHMTTFSNVEFFESSLYAQKEIIKKQKDVLIRVYNQMRHFYTVNQATAAPILVGGDGAGTLGGGLCVDIRTKITDIMRDVNIKVLHVMTAMELMMAADNRTNEAVDGTLHQQFGAPAVVGGH